MLKQPGNRFSRAAKRGLSLLFALVLFLSSMPVSASAPSEASAIVFPSSGESTIAEGRDFYIIGTGEDLVTRGVTIAIYDSANRLSYIRAIYGNVTRYEASIPEVSYYYASLPEGLTEDDLLMPDLGCTLAAGEVADENRSDSKFIVTERNFAALVCCGGSNGLGIAGTPLPAGDYTIKVLIGLKTPDGTDNETLVRSITIGATPDKVAARFSPDAHLTRVKEFAADNGLRVYTDPMPGYWSPGTMGCIYYSGALYTGGDVFLEVKPRWRLADATEYETGTVHLLLYNIKESCATQGVEVAAVQRTDRVDTLTRAGGLVGWYYDIGEPALVNNGRTVEGNPVRLAQGDKLAFTRAEIGEDVGETNRFAAWMDSDAALDTNVGDGITVAEGEELALYGVTAPIQNAAAEILRVGQETAGWLAGAYDYAMDGMTLYIEYSVSDADGHCLLRFQEPTFLSRTFTEGGSAQQSIYEFKHLFPQLPAGAYTVEAVAIDQTGNPLDAALYNGVETFTLTVGSETEPERENGARTDGYGYVPGSDAPGFDEATSGGRTPGAAEDPLPETGAAGQPAAAVVFALPLAALALALRGRKR